VPPNQPCHPRQRGRAIPWRFDVDFAQSCSARGSLPFTPAFCCGCPSATPPERVRLEGGREHRPHPQPLVRRRVGRNFTYHEILEQDYGQEGRGPAWPTSIRSQSERRGGVLSQIILSARTVAECRKWLSFDQLLREIDLGTLHRVGIHRLRKRTGAGIAGRASAGEACRRIVTVEIRIMPSPYDVENGPSWVKGLTYFSSGGIRERYVHSQWPNPRPRDLIKTTLGTHWFATFHNHGIFPRWRNKSWRRAFSASEVAVHATMKTSTERSTNLAAFQPG